MKKNIFYITGFMGSGKSTIGPILGNTLDWSFFDLDKEIERECKKKIKDIFAAEGENYFREIEKRKLKDLSSGDKIIISLGGGTIAFEENLNFMLKAGYIIYLKSSMEAIFKRLKHKRDRPVLLAEGGESISEEEFLKRVENIFNNRKEFYEKADIVVNTDVLTVGKTVDKLSKIIYSIAAIEKDKSKN